MTNSPFVIKQINMFSGWVYNLPKNNECTICRCNLNTPSLYNQEKGIDSYVVSGACLHSFHQECIKPWVDKNKHCPICSAHWQYNFSDNDKFGYSDIDEFIKMPSLIDISDNVIKKKISFLKKTNDSIDKKTNDSTDKKTNDSTDKKTNQELIMNNKVEEYMKLKSNVVIKPIINKIIYSKSEINIETKKIKIIKKIIDSKIINMHNFLDEDNDKNLNKMINIFKKEEGLHELNNKNSEEDSTE